MTGTSILMPDAVIPQSKVLASLWTPPGVASLLVEEFALGTDAATSEVNHANVGAPASLVGSPSFAAASATVSSTAGFDTNTVPSETDQTFVVVCKAPSGTAGIYAAVGGGWTGILYDVASPKFGFYNTSSGVGPNIAEVSPATSTDYNFVIGWGSQGGVGHIRVGSGGALGAAVSGTANGAGRPTTTTRIGTNLSVGSSSIVVAFAARIPAILTDAQQLAWYLALQPYLGRQGLTVA